MAYEIEASSNLAVVRLKKSLSRYIANSLTRDLLSFSEKGVNFFIFDMHGCDMVDSSGIRCLIRMSRESEPFGKKIAVINCTDKVESFLARLGVDEWAVLFAGEEHAREYFLD